MSPFDLNLRHLRAVAAIRASGSISRAAGTVALSQPAVTQGIAKLEQQLGAQLFDRGPQGMAASDAGGRLADRVDAASEILAEAFEAIRRARRSGFRGAENLVTMSQARALLALSDGGSFLAAAQATGLAQPSVHRAVRDVERLSGATLAERRGRGVRLTDAGRRLARGFSLAIGEIEAALDEIAALAGRETGRIRVGAMPLARALLLPRAIARFHPDHPNVPIEIVDGGHDELIERLRDGRLDFLIGALRDPSPGADFAQQHLFDDALMVIARAGHPLAAQPFDAETLRAYTWIMAREGTPLRRLWRGLFDGSPPPAPVTCGSVMAIRSLLLESDFLTLLSPDQVRGELSVGVLTGIGGPIEATRRPIGLTTRVGWRPGPAQRQFVELLIEIARRGTLSSGE